MHDMNKTTEPATEPRGKTSDSNDLLGVIDLAHRMAWRYKKSADPGDSDTYTFNDATMEQFARKLTAQHTGSNYVYEIIDATDDEQYFTQGVFSTLEDARNALREQGRNPIGEYAEESETVKIVERRIGWSGAGKIVLEITRNEELEDANNDDSEYVWPDMAELIPNA